MSDDKEPTVATTPETVAETTPETVAEITPETVAETTTEPVTDTAAEPQDAASEDADAEPSEPEVEKFDVVYSCLRCATKTPASELERLPEIKCICGFRVFIKDRPPLVKSIKAF